MVLRKSLVFILQFISNLIFNSSLVLLHFTFFFPLLIFILNVILSLAATGFQSSLLLFLLPPVSQNHFFLVISQITFIYTFLKYPYFLSTFINLCLSVVDMVVVAFLNFISRSSLLLCFKSQILPLCSPIPFSLLPALSFFHFNLKFLPILSWFAFLTLSILSPSMISKITSLPSRHFLKFLSFPPLIPLPPILIFAHC